MVDRQLDMQRRAMDRGRGARIPGALMVEEMEEYSENEILNKQIMMERRRMQRGGDGEFVGDDDQDMGDY